MEKLKYKVIRTKTQYDEYCKKLEGLVFAGSKDSVVKDEIDLLTVLIEKWDAEHNTFDEIDPIRLLPSFMDDHKLVRIMVALTPSLIHPSMSGGSMSLTSRTEAL